MLPLNKNVIFLTVSISFWVNNDNVDSVSWNYFLCDVGIMYLFKLKKETLHKTTQTENVLK